MSKCSLNLGPERPQVYSNLSQDEKDRYNADIRATNIILQGLPKDIYSLINHYTDAKDIWDNVKMLLEGSELTKEDRAVVMGEQERVGEMLIQVKLGRQDVADASSRVWGCLVEEQLLFLAGGQDNAIDEDVDEQLVQDLALNVDNVFQADDCDAYDFDVDEAPTAQTMFMAIYLSAMAVVIHHEETRDARRYNDVHKSDVLSVSHTPRNTVANNLLNAELATYKEQVELYERRARFELTEREQKIDEQLRIVICDRNIKEENLKKELHSVKLQLASTNQHNSYGDELLYSGHVIVTPNHAPAIVRDCEETLEQSEISRKKMHDKMKANECVDNKVNITPPNYSKENFLATFTPQKQLTPEQLFWSQDIVKMKAEALKEQNTRPIKALTVYPPNTPATLVPRVLPTKSQVKINIFTLRQLFSEFEKTCKKRITPTGITEGERGFKQNQGHKALTKEVKEMSDAFDELEAELDQSVVDRKHDEIERKNLLIEHDNIIADGLSKEVFYVASNSELNVSRFTEMQKTHNVVKACCLELEAELSNLRDNIHKDNYNELLNRFSNLEVNHLNLQLKYQNLKDNFQNKPSSSVNDTPDFNSVFVIGQMKASLQGKDNVIQKLKMHISQLQETRSELDRTLDFRARDFQILQLTEKVNGIQEQNEIFRAENAKIKQHFKELLLKTYDGGSLKAHEFREKVYRTVRFGNDHFGAIMGYGDYVIGDSVIFRVYYVEGLGHNLFSVALIFMMSPPNLLAIQSLKHKSGYGIEFKSLELRYLINDLTRKGPCKSKKHTHKPKTENTNLEVLNTLHMDLCEPMRAKVVATACYTQNRSLIHTRHDKTPFELVHNKKPDLTFFRVFGALCYPTNDSENLGKLQPRADIGSFIGYAPSRKGYRIYNKRTRQIMETIHVQFDELTEQIAPVQSSPGPAPNLLTPGPISSGLVPNPAPVLPYVPPTNKELEILFQPMFDEYFNPPGIRQDLIPNVAQDPVIPLGEQYAEVNPFAAADPEPFVNVFAPDYNSEASSSGEITVPESNQSTLPHEHIRKWTDSHPLDNIIGNPSRPNKAQLVAKGFCHEGRSVLKNPSPRLLRLKHLGYSSANAGQSKHDSYQNGR
ncbi:integrase, catalytic region, zinc finger, CCHC-type containing protein [Tanacetum coccineum]